MARINKGSQQQANYYFERGNPEPLDASMLYNSYSDDIKKELKKEYDGMYTAVEDSENSNNNGPYYVNSSKIPERIILKSEVDASNSYILGLLKWGELS